MTLLIQYLQLELAMIGYDTREVREIDYGHQIRLADGVIINFYNTGKYSMGGKMGESFKEIKRFMYENKFKFKKMLAI